MHTRTLLLGLTAAISLAACNSEQTTQAPSDDLPQLTFGRVPAPRRAPRFVATATNAVAGNAILFYARNSDGSLAAPISFPTGGTGSGGGLGNQGGIALDAYAMHLYAVNAGSNSISVFAVQNDGLVLEQVVPSGGTQPISLAVSDELLYVLNDGGVANVSGFRIRGNGRLDALANSTRALTVDVPDAAQIGFNRSERRLIVTEKATNNIVTFRLDRGDRPEAPIVTVSSGATPFGFYVSDRRGELIVSEAFGGAANASAVSSYRLRRGIPQVITASAPTTESAACWIALSGDGKFVYTSNTASNTISGYTLARDGSLTLLNADGVTATTGAGPIDLATRENLDFLYSLDRAGSQISIYRITGAGALQPRGVMAGLPTSANGLVVN
jgi:6-phosphogluconolactonase